MFSNIKSLFKKMWPTLKMATPILSVVIAVLLNVTIWWSGPWITIYEKQPLASLEGRVIASLILSLTFFILWGFLQFRKLNKFKQERSREKKIEVDPVLRFVERQESEFNQIVDGLKNSLNKHNYLYSLPWYLVIGLENSGKTSLINRSGQTFVFSSVMRTSGKKSENPYAFNWWIGDNSVLIDPDGELLSQGATHPGSNGEVQRRLWLHFIDWLERTRSRRPLNGVVVTLDIAKLTTASASERIQYANVVRARLRELMEKLSTRMPVYITLTKLDLLTGFELFFNNYSKEQREEVLGFTFNLNETDNLDIWQDEFDLEFVNFIEKINSMMPNVLLNCRNEEDRTSIFSFSRQIAGLHEVITQFLKDALGSDQFSTSALVRGIYFTSVFQIGVPENAFIDSASRRYNLPKAINSAQRVASSTTYFAQKLFSQVIYPEAGLASDNFRVAKQKRRIMLLSGVACSIGFVLLVGSWQHYYMKNSRQAEAVLEKVNLYSENYSAKTGKGLQQEILEPLDAIREATLEFGFFRDRTRFISDLGLYQGHKIGPDVENTYLNLLENLFLPELMKTVVSDIASLKSDKDRLEALRIYRMITDKTGRYKRLVQQYFAHKWQEKYFGDRKTQVQLMKHLDYAMQHTDLQAARLNGLASAEALFKPYDPLIARTQEKMSKIPVEERVYRNLKDASSDTLGSPLNLATSIGPIFDLLFFVSEENKKNIVIPKMLSKQGLENYFISKYDSVSELALVDRWVLGQADGIEFSEQDKQALREKMRELYIADYADTWRRAMNSINIKYFPDINSAVVLLENLDGNTQPLSRLLSTLTQNTMLFPKLPENDAARQALEETASYKIAAVIDNQFSSINSMVGTDDEQPAYLDEVGKSISQLLAFMKIINNAPDVGKAALEATKNRVTLQNADPIYQLERVAEGMPMPFQVILKKMAQESWQVVKQEAIRYLEKRWAEDVYAMYFEKLAPRYPFNRHSEKDVALVDFEAFFAPNGKLSNFYNENLKIFIEDSSSLSDSGEENTLIRSDVLKQLKVIGNIQKAFFNRKGVMDVGFSIEPLELSANKRRSLIVVDGQFVEYSHGPRKNVGLIWPNSLRDSANSKVTLVPSEANASPRSIDLHGTWAFFRLLDKGEVVASTETSVDYRFNIDKGNVTYRLHSEANNNPFTVPLFKNFTLSNTLY